MATNGVINTNDSNGRFLTLVWALQSQSYQNNESVITWQLKGSGNAPAAWYYARNFKVIINGSVVFSSSNEIQLFNGTVVNSGTLTIAHNQNGNKTFAASVEAIINSQDCSGAEAFNLPQISRYASVVNAYNFNDESNPKIEFLNPANSKLQLRIDAAGTVGVVIREITNPASPYTFNLSAAERNALRDLSPNNNILNVTYSIGTYENDTIVNYSTAPAEMIIINAAPVITGASYKDTNETTAAFTGDDSVIVQNLSTIQIIFAGLEALKGAKLASVAATINGVTVTKSFDVAAAYNSKLNFGVADVANDTNAEILLTDTRGNTSALQLPVTFAAYTAPSALVSCARVNNNQTATNLTVNATFSPVGGNNSIAIVYQTKREDGSTWGAETEINNNTTTVISLNNNYRWFVRIKINDLLGGETIYNLQVNRGTPIIFVDNVKNSVGFNCYPVNDNSIESAGRVLDDLIYIGGQTLYDKYVISAAATEAILGVKNWSMIDGLFANYPMPADYTRAYRITAQVTTAANNYVKVKLNNIETNAGSTNSNDSCRAIIGSRLFKEGELNMETLFNYPAQYGLNLYVNNSAAATGTVYNITLNGYLVKTQTVLPDPQTPDVNINAGG